jgi:hypothetical protein
MEKVVKSPKVTKGTKEQSNNCKREGIVEEDHLYFYG